MVRWAFTVWLLHPLHLAGLTVQSASRSMKVIATALKEHGAYAPEVGATTHHPRMDAAAVTFGSLREPSVESEQLKEQMLKIRRLQVTEREP